MLSGNQDNLISQNKRQMSCICLSLFIFFLGLHLQIMEVPKPGVELELQLLAYATATATRDPSFICNLHYSSWRHQILKPLSKVRDWTHILLDASGVHYCWATMGTPLKKKSHICLLMEVSKTTCEYWTIDPKSVKPDLIISVQEILGTGKQVKGCKQQNPCYGEFFKTNKSFIPRRKKRGYCMDSKRLETHMILEGESSRETWKLTRHWWHQGITTTMLILHMPGFLLNVSFSV